MRRILLSLLCILAYSITSFAQQPRYLVNTIKPEEGSQFYTPAGSGGIFMGGTRWKNGFALGKSGLLIAPEDLGHVEFRLGGAYDKLTFYVGAVQPESPESTISLATGILCIYADGNKVFDRKINTADAGSRCSINVAGVNILKFQVLVKDIEVGIAEAALWKAGESPRETGGPVLGKASKVQLVKDLKPYTIAGRHSLVTGSNTVAVGNKSYSNALLMDMSIAIVGENSGVTFFNLDRRYETLSLIAGPVNEQHSSNGLSWITIKGDGKILHEYEIRQDDIARPITVNVKGVQQLAIQSDQSDHSMKGAVVEAFVYPDGVAPVVQKESSDARLKSLPDACKLISNIPPYSTRSNLEKQVYDGKSDYITFSMGGVRFSEGFILYKTSNIMDDSQTSYAAFDLGGEFDYVSFTVGFVGKSWAMTNDVLSVYADDRLIKTIPVYATMQNLRLTLPIDKCRKLRVENAGSGKMESGAYGVGDLVVWRGKPGVDNLFYHEVPDCPDEIGLIDLGAPYIHYVSSMKDNKEDMFYDGSTQRHYVTRRDGSRLNKCFLLKTSVHFSLDYGVLSDMDGAMGSIAGAVAAGVSFVPVAAVGGAYVGATLAGAAALLVLAAGGEAVENSCAAFNTYGQYNSLTFTVECLRTQGESQILGPDSIGNENGSFKEHLLIGSNQQVIAEMAVYEDMKPQTVTVPIEGCEQLMFWLANTDNSSATFVFYDIKLSKQKCVLDIPDEAKLSKAFVEPVAWRVSEVQNKWERVPGTGLSYLDGYLNDLYNAYSEVEYFLEYHVPHFEKYTYYLSTRSGDVVKGVKLRDTRKEVFVCLEDALSECEGRLKTLSELRSKLAEVTLAQANAYLDLPSLGLGAVKMGKVLKSSGVVLKELKVSVDEMREDLVSLRDFLVAILSSAMDVDGMCSKDDSVICPLFKGESVPDGDRMLVENFTL